MAGALFFLGILVVLGCLCGPVPIVLGLVALGRIEQSGGRLRGRGLAIGAIVLGILALLALPVLIIGGLLIPTTLRSSTMTGMPISPPRVNVSMGNGGISVMTAPTVMAPMGSSTSTSSSGGSNLASEDREMLAENAYGELYKKVDGELKDDPAAQLRAIQNFVNTYADTTVAHRAKKQLLAPRLAKLADGPATKNETTDIVVPPDVLAKAEKSDTLEMIDPSAEDKEQIRKAKAQDSNPAPAPDPVNQKP